MIIETAEFLQSNTQMSKLPEARFPEFAFIGRSNVGKSSLINAITGKKGLAKTSGKPGKTITVNHFLINKNWYLVDLPGYGFAKRSKTEREKWDKLMRNYMMKRENLVYTFILIDSRLEPQKIDLDFIEWMAESQVPFVIVFTKTDKLGKTAIATNLDVYKKQLLQNWEELPIIISTSAISGKGKDEVLDLIEGQTTSFKAFNSTKI
ncbi:MAG: YihA family ribosome biogenesis GTP-binding protein [Bacteroidales bacterium]|nr:YihA family ribosome biogenesis GTP-binding protein [Bacteroidales bacterium]